jgi:predicted DNA-binding protein
MVTITCKISRELNDRLKQEAARKQMPKSSLVREALEQLLNRLMPPSNSAFDQVKNIAGIVKDGPSDMSANPRYMDGFGK